MLTCLFASGKNYYFKHYQVDDGLLHNNVTSILQDKSGFMWIGTRGGLNRFDGQHFKQHLIHSNRSGANYIRVIREDKKGFIWVGTQTGIFKFDPVSESFQQINLLPSLNIRDLKVDSDGNLWIIANASLYKYDQSSCKMITFDLSLTALDIDEAGNIWVATLDGHLKKISSQSKHISSLHIPNNEPFERGAVTQIKCVDQNNLLIGTMRGLFTYDVHTKTIANMLSQNEQGIDIYVREIYADGTTHYIATESGVFIYDAAIDRITHLKKIPGDHYGLNDNAVYAVFVDNDSGVWVGTFFGGLNYFSQQASYFEKYYPLNMAGSISGNAVREICGDRSGNIWIGTEDAGINKLDVSTGKFTHINHQNPTTGISYPNIHGLLIAGNHLLAGPFIHGFEVMDINTGQIIDRQPWIRAGKNDISGMVMSIFKTTDHRILVGTTGAGLHEYNPDSHVLSPIKPIPSNSFVYAIAEDHQGTIWTGSLVNGAFYFNPKTGEYGNVNFNKINDTIKHHYTVQGIYEDSQKSLWFATEGGGLVKVDSTRKLTKRFTMDEGLPSNNIYRILEDDFGNLWISSLKGLICFNIYTEQFHVYTKSNGLITDQFNYNSAYKAANGKMYFGTVRGMIAFHPEDLIRKRTPPPTHITNLQINNKDILPSDSTFLLKKSMLFTDAIVLDHHQASFNIEFAALDFSSPEVVKYKYQLEGLDKEWTYLSANRKAYFTGLPAGTYRFVLQAESNVGYWTGEKQYLTITILPPFWKSLPAYVLYAVLFILLVSLIAYAYHQTVKRKNLRRLQLFELEKEREIYQAKIEFFTNIAHEIQTPLTLIKGPVEWALSQINDTDTVERNLRLVEKNTDRLVSLTAQLLDFRKMEIDQFGLNFVLSDINQLLRDCVKNFQSEIERTQREISLILPDPALKAPVDQEAFIKIISNLLSNAIKYGNRRIDIQLFTLGKNTLKVSIINDGEFILPMYRKKIFEPFFRIPGHLTLKGTGIGLSLAKSLAELHGGQLDVVEREDRLTAFELILPLDQKVTFELNVKEHINDHERNTIDY